MKKICRTFCLYIFTAMLMLILAGCEETGYTELEGIFVRTDSGNNVLLQEGSDGEYRYVFLEERDETEGAFEDLDTGDLIKIKVVIINGEDGVMSAEVFGCEKISDGSEEEIDSADMEEISELDVKYNETI